MILRPGLYDTKEPKNVNLGKFTMDNDNLFMEAGFSLEQVDPINQKRLLAFINFWLSRMVTGLNTFAKLSESKLSQLEKRIEKTDTSLLLLEAKLASIPGLDDPVAVSKPAEPQLAPVQAEQTVSQTQVQSEHPPEPTDTRNAAVPPNPSSAVGASSEAEQPTAKNTARNDPKYARYFKMITLGVPEAAVKQKMELEGVDPSVLDNPDSEVTAPPTRKESSSGSEFASSSDDDSMSD